MLEMLRKIYRKWLIVNELETMEEIIFTSRLRLARLTKRRDEYVTELNYDLSEDKRKYYAERLNETMCAIDKEDKIIERMTERVNELRDELNEI